VKLQVVGLGNELRGDDGIGPRMINELQYGPFAQSMKLVNAGADAFIVLEYLRQENPVVIIDCAQMGKQSGEVVCFDADQSSLAQMDKLISMHGFGLSEIYQMATAIGPVAPCKIIGIQPKSIEFNTGLSPEVENSIKKIENLVIEEIKRNVKKDINY